MPNKKKELQKSMESEKRVEKNPCSVRWVQCSNVCKQGKSKHQIIDSRHLYSLNSLYYQIK